MSNAADPVYPPGSTPPKSATRIRKTLKAIHGANPAQPAGPLQRGLSKENWIAVESLGDASYYRSLLSQHQIEFRTRTRRGKTSVLVQLADLSLARELLGRVPGEMRRGVARQHQRRRTNVALIRRSTSIIGSGQVGMGLGTLMGLGIGVLIDQPEWAFIGAFFGFLMGILWGAVSKSNH